MTAESLPGGDVEQEGIAAATAALWRAWERGLEALPLVPQPPMLWHYTPHARAIVASGALYAKRSDLLDDPTEGKVGQQAIRSAREVVWHGSSEYERRLWDAATDAIGRPFYVASLCESPRSAHLWNEYADHGSGDALGFSGNRGLRAYLSRPVDPTEHGQLSQVVPIVYEPDHRAQLVAQSIGHEIKSLAIQPDTFSEAQAVEIVGALANLCHVAMKKRRYRHEREWRVVVRLRDGNLLSALES